MRFIPALHEGTPQWFVAATSVTVFGCATLLSIVQKSFAGPAGGVPKMLLVSPPAFGKFSPFMDLFFHGGEATGRGLGTAYATVA